MGTSGAGSQRSHSPFHTNRVSPVSVSRNFLVDSDLARPYTRAGDDWVALAPIPRERCPAGRTVRGRNYLHASKTALPLAVAHVPIMVGCFHLGPTDASTKETTR